MGRFVEEVVVDRSVDIVYGALVDLTLLDQISEHVTNVERLSAGEIRIGFRWSQHNVIHGRAYAQTVEVTHLDPGRRFATRRVGAGVTMSFSYVLAQIRERHTRVTLVKEAIGSGLGHLLVPLADHFLKKPEHDGRHLDSLKVAIENRFPPLG